MALSDLTVFSEYTYLSLTEVLAQQVDLFNAASAGTIVLRSAAHQGDFSDKAFWGSISGLVRRRNAYGNGAVDPKHLSHVVDTMVKVAAGTPPVEINPSQFTWIQRNPEEGGAVFGQQLAKATLADMLNTGLMAYVAATVGHTADVSKDLSANPTDFNSLLQGAAMFGDRSADLQAWAMHSKTLFDIFGVALANAGKLFVFGNVAVRQDGFGRPFVVSDSPSMIIDDGDGDGPEKHYAGGLTAGAITVEMNEDFDQNVQTLNGNENIGRTIQAEWTYNLGIKGYAWDKTNGGKSPNDAAIATGTNWDRFATSFKDTAGVLLTLQ